MESLTYMDLLNLAQENDIDLTPIFNYYDISDPRMSEKRIKRIIYDFIQHDIEKNKLSELSSSELIMAREKLRTQKMTSIIKEDYFTTIIDEDITIIDNLIKEKKESSYCIVQ